MSKISFLFEVFGLTLINYIVYRAVFRTLYNDYGRIKKILNNGFFTKGTIVGFESKVDLDQRDQYSPIVRFIASDGVEYLVKSDDFKFIKPPIDSVVDVCYDIESPLDAIVNPRSLLEFKMILMLFIVVVMLAINIGILYKVFN